MARRLDELGEFPFIDAVARLVKAGGARRGVRIGIGDDAALVDTGRSTLLTTDTLTEDVHFRRDWLTPGDLGRRAFRVAVSDIAAMGGRARYVLLSLSLPAAYEAARARQLVRGLVRDVEGCGAALVGGNVSGDRKIALTVTVAGEPGARVLRRDGARPGHDVYVTGPLGSARAGREQLAGGARRGLLVSRFRKPPIRLEAGHALAGIPAVGAMIDISDGLAQDLGHVCRASGVTIELDREALPVEKALARAVADPAEHALAGGDDYELAFTAPASIGTRLERACATGGGLLIPIGRVVAGPPRVIDRSGRELAAGYRHFARRG